MAQLYFYYSAMNAGKFPFVDNNNELSLATHIAVKAGNLRATTDVSAYSDADIVVVDVQLDISRKHNELNADFRTKIRFPTKNSIFDKKIDFYKYLDVMCHKV